MYISSIVWEFTRKMVFERDRYICQYCGSVENLTVDHLWPRSKGGKNGMSNLVTCCAKCNSKKGDKTLREWIEGKDKEISANIEIPSKVIANKDTMPLGLFHIPPRKLVVFFDSILDGTRISQNVWAGSRKLLTRTEFDTVVDLLIKMEILEWKREEWHAQGVRFSPEGHNRLRFIRDQIVASGVIQ